MRLRRLFALTALLLAPALGAAPDPQADTQPAPQPAAALPVIAAVVRRVPVADPVEALGTLTAREAVTVSANVTETVSAIHFEDGQRVHKGDLLVELTSAEEQALMAEGRARVDEAKRQFERVKSLAGSRSVAESLLDERRRDLDTARAALVAVESRLADRLIKAPFDGVLGLRQISVGALVEPAKPITTLDDRSTMKLDFSVPSIYLADLRPGLPVTARAPAYADQGFSGTLSAVDSRIDPVTRSIQVRALIPNPDDLLKPGLLMQVVLLRNPREALVVPESALLQQAQDHFVMRVGAGDRAERVHIQIGTRRPGEVEVTAGLKDGERVITQGQDRVRPGQAVSVRLDDGTRPLKDLLGARP